MKVLVTRSERDSAKLAAALAARGIDTLVEPLTAIHFRPNGADLLHTLLPGAQAVLFTSANGARAFAAATARRELRVFAVGDATAAAARAAGFSHVASADGAVGDLAKRAIASLAPGDGAVIHAAGSVVAGDLNGLLGAAGFTVRRAVLYDAVPAEILSGAARAAMTRGEIEAAMFFSPRNAATFVRLATELGEHCARILALGLSPAVAAALGGLRWRRVVIAAAPNEAALLRALEESLATERSA